MHLKRCEALLWASDTNIEQVKTFLELTDVVQKWAIAPHTIKGVPHYHVFLELVYPVDVAAIAAWFNIVPAAISSAPKKLACYFAYLVKDISSYDVIANFDFIAALNRR